MLIVVLQMTDALDIVNHNFSDMAVSWDVYRQQIKTMQEAEVDLDNSDLIGSGDSLAVQQTSMLKSQMQYSQQAQSNNCDESASSCVSEVTCVTADVGEKAAKNDKSVPRSATSLAKVTKDRNVVTRLFSDAEHQTDADTKAVAKLQKTVASRTPKKSESTSVVKKVGSSSNVTPRQSSLTAQRSLDLSSSRSSAQFSSRVSSKPVDLTPRRPSVPTQPVKQTAVTGSSKPQTLQMRRKSSSASTAGSALQPDQKTTSESSPAAGDFGSDLPISTSLRSSTPVTSSVGDSNSNNASRSISRVSSISDASSLPESHASSGAVSAPVGQASQQSTATGKPLHLQTLWYFPAVVLWPLYRTACVSRRF